MGVQTIHKAKTCYLYFSLYLCGFNPQLHKIYPKVQFPVGRGTPMLSPLIKWNHEQDWFVTTYKAQITLKTGDRTIGISSKEEDWKYIMGHVIDGQLSY